MSYSHTHNSRTSNVVLGFSRGAAVTFFGMMAGSTIGISLSIAFVFWGWTCLAVMATAMLAMAMLVEGVHRKW